GGRARRGRRGRPRDAAGRDRPAPPGVRAARPPRGGPRRSRGGGAMGAHDRPLRRRRAVLPARARAPGAGPDPDHAAGDRTAALRALAEALALGAPEGYVRVFLDEGAPVGALLRELAGGRRLEQLGVRAVPRAFLAGLIAAFDRHGGRPAPRGAGPVPGMAGPLSTRELEVLTLMASGHPNRA